MTGAGISWVDELAVDGLDPSRTTAQRLVVVLTCSAENGVVNRVVVQQPATVSTRTAEACFLLPRRQDGVLVTASGGADRADTGGRANAIAKGSNGADKVGLGDGASAGDVDGGRPRETSAGYGIPPVILTVILLGKSFQRMRWV